MLSLDVIVNGTDVGRGLGFVAALSDRWGYCPFDGGKSVWFETELS